MFRGAIIRGIDANELEGRIFPGNEKAAEATALFVNNHGGNESFPSSAHDCVVFLDDRKCVL